MEHPSYIQHGYSAARQELQSELPKLQRGEHCELLVQQIRFWAKACRHERDDSATNLLGLKKGMIRIEWPFHTNLEISCQTFYDIEVKMLNKRGSMIYFANQTWQGNLPHVRWFSIWKTSQLTAAYHSLSTFSDCRAVEAEKKGRRKLSTFWTSWPGIIKNDSNFQVSITIALWIIRGKSPMIISSRLLQ